MAKSIKSKFSKALLIYFLIFPILSCSQGAQWKETNFAEDLSAKEESNAILDQEPRWTGLVLSNRTPELKNIQEVRDYLKEISKINDGVKLRLYLNDENSGMMKISCPVNVLCDENYGYRAYSGNVPSLRFYASFESKIAKDLSASSIIKNFSYVSYRIYFPILNRGKWKLSSVFDSVLEKSSKDIKWQQRNDGKIQLTIVGKINEIWADLDEPRCKTVDDAPDQPDCCASIPVDISYEIVVDRELENLVSLDCKDPKNHTRCG